MKGQLRFGFGSIQFRHCVMWKKGSSVCGAGIGLDWKVDGFYFLRVNIFGDFFVDVKILNHKSASTMVSFFCVWRT